MATRVFREYKEKDGVNDTLTVTTEGEIIKFYSSCGRSGVLKFRKNQISSLIDYLQKIIE